MKRFSTSVLAITASLLMVPFFCGCGAEKMERPAQVFPVQGQVTWQGKPVADADITFHNAVANRSAFGRTDADGNYQLTTFEANDGAVAGPQVITVTKIESLANTTPIADVDSADYVPPTASRKTVKAAKPKPLIPVLYSSQSTSPLNATVHEDDQNVVNLELK